MHIKSGVFQNFTGEGRCRRLAIGAGDGNDLSFQEACRQLHFANYGYTLIARLDQWSDIVRNTGADDDHILSAEGALAVAARLDGNAAVEQLRNFFAELRFVLGIGDSDLRTALLQEVRGRDS